MTVLHSGASTKYSDNWADAFGEAKPRRAKKKASTQRTRPARKKQAAAAKRKGATARKKVSAKKKGTKAKRKLARRA